MPKDHMRKEDRQLAAHEVSRESNNYYEASTNLQRSPKTHRLVFEKFASGPHIGKTIEEVPIAYLQMLVEESNRDDSSICLRASDAAKKFLSTLREG